MHLREGVHDLALLVGPGRYEGFNYLTLPYTHHWGLLVSADSPLAAKKRIVPADTKGIPLISSRQGMVREFIAGWLGFPYSRLNVVATYNLFYNAAMFVEAGIRGSKPSGDEFAHHRLARTDEGDPLCVRRDDALLRGKR